MKQSTVESALSAASDHVQLQHIKSLIAKLGKTITQLEETRQELQHMHALYSTAIALLSQANEESDELRARVSHALELMDMGQASEAVNILRIIVEGDNSGPTH